MHCNIFFQYLFLRLLHDFCLADEAICLHRIQQYGQKYCKLYGSLCASACGLQIVKDQINPTFVSAKSEPAACAMMVAKYGKAYYCGFYGPLCQISCDGYVANNGGSCPYDHPKCDTCIQTYGLHYYCSLYGPLCAGPCRLPCASATYVFYFKNFNQAL